MTKIVVAEVTTFVLSASPPLALDVMPLLHNNSNNNVLRFLARW